jgi:hypothetical protein
MSHIRANEYRSQAGATNRRENIVIRYVSFISLSLIYLYLFEFESSRCFQFSLTDFSLVYRFAFAQIFPRSQPMRKSNTSTHVHIFDSQTLQLVQIFFLLSCKKTSQVGNFAGVYIRIIDFQYMQYPHCKQSMHI